MIGLLLPGLEWYVDSAVAAGATVYINLLKFDGTPPGSMVANSATTTVWAGIPVVFKPVEPVYDSEIDTVFMPYSMVAYSDEDGRAEITLRKGVTYTLTVQTLEVKTFTVEEDNTVVDLGLLYV